MAPFGGTQGVYPRNHGAAIDNGDGTISVFYTRRYPSGDRVNKQIYYMESLQPGNVELASAIAVKTTTPARENNDKSVRLPCLARSPLAGAGLDSGDALLTYAGARRGAETRAPRVTRESPVTVATDLGGWHARATRYRLLRPAPCGLVLRRAVHELERQGNRVTLEPAA